MIGSTSQYGPLVTRLKCSARICTAWLAGGPTRARGNPTPAGLAIVLATLQ